MQNAIAILIVAAAAYYLAWRWAPESAKLRIRRATGTLLAKAQRICGVASIASESRELLRDTSDHDTVCAVCDRCELRSGRSDASTSAVQSGYRKNPNFSDRAGCH